MNLRFKLALIRHFGTRNSDNKGFAVVIALGLGLVMIVIALTMVIRSQSDQVLGSTQKSTSRSLSAAEVGVSRYQYLLNTVRILAQNNYSTWSNPTAIAGYSSCSGGSIDTDAITGNYANQNWKDIDSQTQYRLINYYYTETNANALGGQKQGEGLLTVEGRVNVSGSGNSATTDSRTSTARLQVKIPVMKTDPNLIPVPGVWTKVDGMAANSGQQVNGDILVPCSVSDSTVTTMEGTTGNNGNLWNKDINDVIKTGIGMPSVPTVPTTQILDLGDINSDTQLGSTTIVGSTQYTVTATTSASKFGAGVYVYKINNINNGTFSIPAGDKVVIFLTGMLDKNVTISHPCGTTAGCKPSDVVIFGTGTTVPNGTTPTICLNGNNSLDAFILAPTYAVAVSGGGGDVGTDATKNPTGNGAINGGIWANQWDGISGCGSGSNKIVVKKDSSITWDNLVGIGLQPQYVPPTIDIPSSWQKQQVQ